MKMRPPQTLSMTFFRLFALLPGLILLGLSSGPLPASSPDSGASPITVEQLSGREIRILSARAVSGSEGLMVSGTVESQPGFENAFVHDHLEIVALSAGGSVLAQVSTHYFPHPISGRRPITAPRASFSEILPVKISSVSLIRVIYHRDR